MALALDASTPAIKGGNNPTWASNAFTPPANGLIVVVVENTTNSTLPTTITDSLGTPLTYTLLKSQVNTGNSSVAVYTADAPASPVSMTVSATGMPAGSAVGGAVGVLCFTGAATSANQTGHTTGANAPNMSSTGIALTAAASTSWVFGAIADFTSNAATISFPTGQSDSLPSGTSQEWHDTVDGDCGWIQGNTAVGNSNLTMKTTAPTGALTGSAGIAFEILAASGGSSTSSTPSGQIKLAGTSGALVTHKASPSGQIILGGSSTSPVSHKSSPSGQIILGGKANSSLGGHPSFSPTGQILLGGSAGAKIVHSAPLSGQIILGGSSKGAVSHRSTPTGQVILGGSVFIEIVNPSYTSFPTGQIKLGGSSTAKITHKSSPSGQVILGGSVAITYQGAAAPAPPRMCYPLTAGITSYTSFATVAAYTSAAAVGAYTASSMVANYTGSAAIAAYTSSGGISPYTGSAAIAPYTGSAAAGTCG